MTQPLSAAQAQAWPNQPISLVVPFPAGGTTDILARAIAERLTPVLDRMVIVDSKPGAGATPGADHVGKSKPAGCEMQKIIQSPEFMQRMTEIGAEPVGHTPEQMARQIQSETVKFARLVKEAKVTID